MSLPLREYYCLPRAAELLGCDIDDLLHWAKMRKIYLCINLKNAKGKIDVFDWRKDYQELINKYNFPSIEGIKSKKEQLLFSLVTMTDNNNKDICRDLLKSSFSLIEFVKDGVSYVDPVCNIYISTNEAIDIISETDSIYVSVDVDLDGVFIIDNDSFYDDVHSLTIEDYSTIISPKEGFLIGLCLDDDIRLSVNDLFILKNDFLKIKEASNNGGEIYIDDEWSREYETSKPEKAVRTSSKAKLAIKALIANHHPEIKSNPAKVAEVLTAEARQAGLGDVTFDKNTVSNWLKES
ncbi:hypothetical protein IHG37_000129 [Salmonella enterica]|nr:hypothetical protein [Salmonella enterica]